MTFNNLKNLTSLYQTKLMQYGLKYGLNQSKLAFITLAIAMGTGTSAYACNIPKSYYKHVSCTSDSRYFLAVKDSGQPVALIGKNGKRVVDLTAYAQVDATKLNNGLLPVQRAGKVGYINMSGREVVPVVYDVIIGDSLTIGWARAANNNRIIVKKAGKFGIIDTQNNVILPFASRYKSISDYSQNIAKVVKDDETLWVDKNARRTQTPNTKQTSKSANVDVDKSSVLQANNHTSNTNNRASSIDSRDSMQAHEVWQAKKQDGRWGFVDHKGVPMITFSFDKVTEFSEGLAGVRVNDNWGFIDLSGQLIIPFRFNESGVIRDNNATYRGVEPFVFVDGKAWIGNLYNGTKLCIDKDGVNISCDELEVSTNLMASKPNTPSQTKLAKANTDKSSQHSRNSDSDDSDDSDEVLDKLPIAKQSKADASEAGKALETLGFKPFMMLKATQQNTQNSTQDTAPIMALSKSAGVSSNSTDSAKLQTAEMSNDLLDNDLPDNDLSDNQDKTLTIKRSLSFHTVDDSKKKSKSKTEPNIQTEK